MPDSERKISDGLKNVIRRMLDKDPETRVTLSELKKDKWINEGFHVALDSSEAKAGLFNHVKIDENDSIPTEVMDYAQSLMRKQMQLDHHT